MLTFNLNGSSKEQTDLFVPVLIELFSWFWIVSALSPLVPSCDCVTANNALAVFHFSNRRKILKLRKHLHIFAYFRFYNQNHTWERSILYHFTVHSAFLLFFNTRNLLLFFPYFVMYLFSPLGIYSSAWLSEYHQSNINSCTSCYPSNGVCSFRVQKSSSTDCGLE